MMAHLSILFFLCLLAVDTVLACTRSCSCPRMEDDDNLAFASFKHRHGKNYSSSNEENQAKANFLVNLKTVNDHNIMYDSGIVTFKLAINKFSDKSVDDMKQHKGLLIAPSDTSLVNESTKIPLKTGSIPASFDWRTEGAVTAVKDQGNCGSCWAFSAIAALESANYIMTKKLVTLSEQSLVDCTPSKSPYSCHGCNGGSPSGPFLWVKANDSKIDTMDSYPYTGVAGTCHSNASNNGLGGTITGITRSPSCDEDALKTTIATLGPTTAVMDASNRAFQSYSSGVYNVPDCGTTMASMDHAVFIVGYGTDSNLGDFWIVKNSWGDTWGESGYFRIARNKGNMCGIALWNLHPDLK